MARSRFGRRKSRARATARRTTRRVHRRKRSNPWPMAGTVAAVNRKRRGRKRSNPRRRRGGYRRNPAILGITLPPLQAVIYAGVGFVGVPMVEGFLSRMLPTTLTASPIGKYATRIGAVLGLSFVAKMVLGSSESKMVAIGGGAYVLTSAVSEFAPGLIPPAGMQAYRPATLGAYTVATRRQLGAPAFGAQNTVRSAGAGGANIVASRFRRFQ